MRVRMRRLVILLYPLVCACGASAESGPGRDSEGSEAQESPAEQPSPEPAPKATDNVDNTKSDPRPEGDTELPACNLGFALSDRGERKCNWYYDGHCYEERIEACACACPRTQDSICSSGFYGGEDSATEVSCL